MAFPPFHALLWAKSAISVDIGAWPYGAYPPDADYPNFLHVRRQVSEKEGQDLAYSVGSAWIETSARNNENVGEAYNYYVHLSIVDNGVFCSQSL